MAGSCCLRMHVAWVHCLLPCHNLGMPTFFRIFVRLVAGAVAVCSLTLAVVAWWIASYTPAAAPTQADAVIVLGAAAWGNKPSPVFRERIRHAVDLYRSGDIRYLIFTGGSPHPDYPSEGDVGRLYALKQGVPDDAIVSEERSHSTWENLEYAQKFFASRDIRTVIIVSDPLHLRRAMLIAEEQGIDAYASPTPSSRFQTVETKARLLWHETWLLLAYFVVHQHY